MNKIIASVLLAVSLFCITSTTYAAKQDYKCFVDSLPKGERVIFYRWNEKDVQLRVASLPGTQLTDNKGKKYYIKSVEECVPLNKAFSSVKAQNIDKHTLR